MDVETVVRLLQVLDLVIQSSTDDVRLKLEVLWVILNLSHLIDIESGGDRLTVLFLNKGKHDKLSTLIQSSLSLKSSTGIKHAHSKSDNDLINTFDTYQ